MGEMKNTIQNLMDKDYKKFIIALISIERNIEDEKLLEEIYNRYIESDHIELLSNELKK